MPAFSIPYGLVRGGTRADRVVGRNIKSHRLALEMSDERFAAEFWCSTHDIMMIECGLLRPNAALLFAIAQLLDCSLSDLFTDRCG